MAADSAIIVLIDIFRLLVRLGVIAALISTQTPAASDHSINHKPPAMDQRWQAMAVLAVAEAPGLIAVALGADTSQQPLLTT
jgi:hypothetical protein